MDDQIVIDFFEKAFINHQSLNTFLESIVIKRIAKLIPIWLNLKVKNINEYAKKERDLILTTLLKFRVQIDRVESIEHAFVNAGGIDVSELDPKSMMSKTHEGLYFIGEINDLQGPIGGFNLTIAFSTGHLAASHIINK
jgi:predicted flavoprotein YhiN